LLLTLFINNDRYLYVDKANKVVETLTNDGDNNSSKEDAEARLNRSNSHGYSPSITISSYDYNTIMVGDNNDGSDDEDDDEKYLSSNIELFTQPSSTDPASGNTQRNGASIIVSAFTISFGSAAKCALLGGLAQMIWAAVRFFDSGSSGYRTMEVVNFGGDVNTSFSSLSPTSKVKQLALTFVRSHTDFALAHCSAYYKSFNTAATDVAQLISFAGVDSLIKQDITTHVCSGFCLVISVITTLVFAVLIELMRNAEDMDRDVSFVDILITCFVVSFSTHFLSLEIMRSSIKTVYIAFAEKPESLSQGYPLVYQRFTRLREANI